MSLALPEATLFAGIDWAAAEHAVCVMDEAGKIVASFTVRHNADGLERLTAAWPSSVSPAVSRSGSSARVAGWWMCCWKRGTRWCR